MSTTADEEPATANGRATEPRADTRSALRSAERQREAAEASRDRFSFLAEVSRCLADSLDYEETLTTVAGMSLPYLEAWCIVDVVDERGEVRRLGVLHHDPEKQEAARALHERYPPRPDDAMGAPRVIRTGRPEMVFDVPDEALVATSHDDEHLELLRKLGVSSYVIVPMVARGETLGAMTFVTGEDGRRFGDIDVVLAEDLARRAAMAVDNARLHAGATASRDDAEAALAEAEAALDEAAAAEEALRTARDTAEEALRTRDEFVSTMTHEVQTPLNAIIGYLELLEMEVAGSLEEAQRAYVDRAQDSARHLLRLVGDVLDFSRTETARLTVECRQVSAADTTRGALAMVRPQAAGRHLTLEDASEGSRYASYLGDEYRVRQILLNLLSNAVKFTPAGGRVSLGCTTVEEEGRPWILFRVADSGEGVRPEDAERIFEPFVQGAAGLTRPYGGTGLGLPISRRLARLMDGDVFVEPGSGRGATFVLRLPASDDVPDTAPPAPPSSGGGEAAAGSRRALAEAAEALMRETDAAVAEFVRRARADPALEFGEGAGDVAVADHLGTLLTDVANSLALLADAQGPAGELLADGSRIQRLIGELHGAGRRRLGWSEAQLRREMEIARSACLEAMTRSLGSESAVLEPGREALDHLLDERVRACLSGFRAAAAAE